MQVAQRHVDTARRVVEAAAGSLMARIVDALTTTEPEAILNDAEARLATATDKGKKAAHAWIIATADQPTDAGPHQEQ